MLTDEQIDRLMDIRKPYSSAKAIERAVMKRESALRKDDESLIRQMLEALEAGLKEVIATGESEGVLFGPDKHVDAKLQAAITAATARLIDSDLTKLTERGAKAWAGVDPQKLREGGAL